MLDISLEKIFILVCFGIIAFVIFELVGMSIFSIVITFYKYFLPQKYKKTLPLYEKCLEKFRDNEHRLFVVLYPISLFGRYFLPYILVLIYILEGIFVFSVFQYPSIRSNEQPWYILTMMLAILVVFGVLTLGMLFYKKIQSATSPRKKYQLIDKIAYIFFFLLFIYQIYQLSLDEKNIFNGFLMGVSDSILKIDVSDRFLSIVIILCLGYGHYKLYSFLEKYFEKKSKANVKKS